MATLRISLLGGLRLAYGDQTIPIPSPQKLVSLLAYLVLHHDRPQDREKLASLFWPDVEPMEARSNLRRHIHLLRQALPDEEWILSDRESIQWDPETDFWLDVEAFAHYVAQAGASEPRQSFEACLELYQGDLLPEIYDDWLIEERERLFQIYQDVLKNASEYEKGRGNYAEALRYARQWLAHHPLQEEACQQVMRLYALSGDRPAALRQFEEFRNTLWRELDVEPLPATLELHRQILADGTPLETGALSRAAIADANQPVAVQQPELVSAQPSRLVKWRGWVLGGITLAVVIILVYSIFAPKSQLVTLDFSGQAVAQDTWITTDFPNDLFWPDDPYKTPHSQYSRAHLQFIDRRSKDRILIRFALDELPANIEIEKAEFDIHLETWTEPEVTDVFTRPYPAQVSIFEIVTPWQADQATFNQPWTQPGLQAGVDYLAQSLDVQAINGTAWLVFDVTGAVQAWINKPASNQGFVIFITAGAEDMAHYWVDLTDQPAPNLRPFLRITYRKR